MKTSSVVTKRKEPRIRSCQSWSEVETAPRRRRLALQSDADFVAFALNASRGNAAYDRLTALLRDLKKLRAETAESARLRRIKKINRGLRQYTFHPCVGLSARNERGFDFAALSDSGFLPLPANQLGITEGDAALILVRLNTLGDLDKLCLCEACRERWLAARHSNYRFCSRECRERFFQSQPDYHQRKARNQRKYREILKRKHAAQDAALKGRK